MQTGSMRPGAAKGFEFIKGLDIVKNAKEASRIATTMLYADFAPSGKMPVIIENEFGGVIFHEACGHGLEASSVAKGHSVFAGKVGQQVASPIVTAIDDGTLTNEWGSLNIDDEGVPTERKVLIENGIFRARIFEVNEDGKPGEDLIQDEIIVKVKKGIHKTSVDVSKYNLQIPDNGIIICFESLLLEQNVYFQEVYSSNHKNKAKVLNYAPHIGYFYNKDIESYNKRHGKWMCFNSEYNEKYKHPIPAINITLTN
jgi:hypothetical protein